MNDIVMDSFNADCPVLLVLQWNVSNLNMYIHSEFSIEIDLIFYHVIELLILLKEISSIFVPRQTV
ncbi:hypothetical protein T12_3732, partial [Trichinella patagoniensis]